MKLFILCILISSFHVFGQTKVSSKNVDHTMGQKEHNCDEPCLKCGHKEACKDTKGNDTSRDKKELSNVDEPNKDHQDHQHNSTPQ